MTLKKLIPFVVFLLVLSACDSEVKPVEFKTNTISTAFEADISVAYDEATHSNDLSKAINKSIETAILHTVNSADKETDIDAVLKHFNDEYLKFVQEYPEAAEPIWELNIESELTYQSPEIITIAISAYEFKGGAHGNDQVKLLNLDAKTGSTLEINDIINDVEGFKKLAEAKFLKSIEKDKNNLTMESFFFGEPFKLPENIGFSEEGLILLYNVYEVASYDLGYTEFMIPFEDAEAFLKVH